VKTIADLGVKIFADGADLPAMRELSRQSYIRGFTTNPTLMQKAGVGDYRSFARAVLAAISDRPISFEVLSDKFPEMEAEAREIASWGRNVYVKVPVTNTQGRPSDDIVRALSTSGVPVNVTAVLTVEQVRRTVAALRGGAPAQISVFAGRIADTGRDPLPTIRQSLELLAAAPNVELIWASPRELLNIFQADELGCHIITVTKDLLQKLPLVGKNLDDFSLETVRMFFQDAQKAGLAL
jgi:transaldolase